MVTESEIIDRAEDTARESHDRLDRVPAGLGDRTRRAERIQQAARELRSRHQQQAHTDEQRVAAAVTRLRRSQQGLPVVGGYRTARTDCAKHEHIWRGRSPRIRPSWTGMPR